MLVLVFAYLLKLKKSGKSPIVISVDLWNECNENCVFCRSEKGEIYDLKTKGEAPIIKGKSYGKLLIEIDGKPNVEVDLVAAENIENVNPVFRVFAAIKYLIFGTSLDE